MRIFPGRGRTRSTRPSGSILEQARGVMPEPGASGRTRRDEFAFRRCRTRMRIGHSAWLPTDESDRPQLSAPRFLLCFLAEIRCQISYDLINITVGRLRTAGDHVLHNIPPGLS